MKITTTIYTSLNITEDVLNDDIVHFGPYFTRASSSWVEREFVVGLPGPVSFEWILVATVAPTCSKDEVGS